MKKTVSITIQEPCLESWHDMLPDEGGRFCGKCSKTVVDFTSMPGRSILQILDQSSGEICGRILPSQMTISVPQAINRQPEFSLRALVFGLALTTFCALNTVAQGNITVRQTEQAQYHEIEEDTIPGSYTIIVQRKDLSRVDSAAIIVYFADGSTMQYMSDSSGVCRFTAERTIANIFITKDQDWQSRFYSLTDFDNANTLIAVLERYEEMIMGKMIVPAEAPKKEPPKKKQ